MDECPLKDKIAKLIKLTGMNLAIKVDKVGVN